MKAIRLGGRTPGRSRNVAEPAPEPPRYGHVEPDAEAISELMEQCIRIIYSRAFRDGLNPTQWSALRFLTKTNRDAQTLSGFCRYYKIASSTAVKTLRSLFQKGLIDRVKDPEDQRVVYLEVTEAGRLLLTRDPMIELSAAIAALPVEVRRAAADAIVRIGDGLLRTPNSQLAPY